jgi:hypothetical protein
MIGTRRDLTALTSPDGPGFGGTKPAVNMGRAMRNEYSYATIGGLQMRHDRATRSTHHRRRPITTVPLARSY